MHSHDSGCLDLPVCPELSTLTRDSAISFGLFFCEGSKALWTFSFYYFTTHITRSSMVSEVSRCKEDAH